MENHGEREAGDASDGVFREDLHNEVTFEKKIGGNEEEAT